MGILGKRRDTGAKSVPAQTEPTEVALWPGRRDRADEVAKAAGIGVIRIRCHTTTWDYLQEETKQQHKRQIRRHPEAFRPATGDEITTSAEGVVTVPLGGSSLAAILDWCFEVQGILYTDLERGIGRRVGRAISGALENLAAARGQGDPAAVIWLDDRIAAADAGDSASAQP
ncbi:polysaccharide deacetylase family protein [Streptomyces sp. NPDC058861]|uniref:polysaccharide deacetylase family protein n=1 Tax=Streptomyces sp. NPDC058861 TaxID=3346653 RepID=UPI0036BD0512